ncbi:DUF262 domain-containing protein [Flavobacterium polysaccharolyticum]|uniref:DUF262 domain-containing protein n=1 Tax=Flavobacterium polysaccharolyticum TaxID=3133148 RepID=A0ABU9NPZ5_9FLAO
MTNVLELKTINELLKYNFFIPSYQRGYRWSENEIIDLLNDISEFKPREVENSNDKTWYCLQPIVVKKINNNLFEVIDGQQRLTSIYLILFRLNQFSAEEHRETLFELEYETRKESSTFLKELANLNDDNLEYQNIDFHYIFQAYKAIKQWFADKGNSFNRYEFLSNFQYNTKVIWYENLEEDSISIFTRINIGKIPLTNSELIKALFLNSSNFEDRNKEKVKLRQLEIATEWDFIEQSLQRNRFWYFLNGKEKSVNRIEFIFDLMNDEDDKNDKYSIFRFFNKKFLNKTKSTIDNNWQEIKQRFQRFSEWYEERDLYHKIGYLVCINHKTIKELYNKSIDFTKSEFRDYLDILIKDSVKNIDLENLQYDDKENVKKILLLYNILTLLKSKVDNSYFPFDLFKNGKWDIEHIASIKDPNNMPDKNRELWLSEASTFIDTAFKGGSELKTETTKFTDFRDDDKFRLLYEDVISHFNNDFIEEDTNHISNLTLLDSETNRSYKNAVFPIKRKTIIDRDKLGVFIPICTKNVFLKYFSEYPPKISFWTQEDRENYEKDLFNVLEDYLKK